MQVVEKVFPQSEQETGGISGIDVVIGKADPKADDQEDDHQPQKRCQQAGHATEEHPIDDDLGEIRLYHPQGGTDQA